MNINSIITEWTYRLPKGYPTQVKDYDVLREILDEMTDLPVSKKEGIVRKAQGLSEADEETADIEQYNTFYTLEQFENVINKYKFPAQEIKNVPTFYRAILNLSDDDQRQIKNLLESDQPALELTTTKYQLSGILLTLFQLIASTIIVTNGDHSELWFSIVFKGKVAGAVSGDEGGDIETDIIITTNKDRVSLKNYKNTSFDLGSLPPEASKYLKRFESLAAVITERQPETSSMTRPDINKTLALLNSESIQSDIDQFLRLNSDVPIIIRLQQQLREILYKQLGTDEAENLDNITKRFCLQVDEFVKQKLSLVDWWGFIIQENILYLRTSNSMIESSTHIEKDGDYFLGPAIANFKGGKLFVNGGEFGISKIWSEG